MTQRNEITLCQLSTQAILVVCQDELVPQNVPTLQFLEVILV